MTRRDVLSTTLLAVAYAAAGTLGLQLAFLHPSATPVWPPSGIALAGLVLLGLRAWPGVFAGALLVNLSTSGLVAALGIATGNTLEAVAGAWLVNRWAGGIDAFDRVGDVFRFAAAAALAAHLSAALGVATLLATSQVDAPVVLPVWTTWWLGDVAGALVVGPAVLLWGRRDPLPRDPRFWLESVGLALTIVGVGTFVFGAFAVHRYPLEFLATPVLAWAALRFGPRGTATACAALSGIAVWGTVRGLGPFARETANAALVLLQTFLAVINVTTLALAAAVRELMRARHDVHEAQERLRRAEREQAAEALGQRDAQLAEAQALAHVGSWVWDPPTDLAAWSDEMYRLFGLQPQSVPLTLGDILERIHPDDRPEVGLAVRRAQQTGEPFDIELRALLDDRSVRWLRARGKVLPGPDGPVRLLGTAQDITESRSLEQARRAFIANAAHELRTPLTAMVGSAELLGGFRHRMSDDEIAEYCTILQRQGVRARRLVSALLDLSRLDQGLLALDLQAVNLAELAARAVAASAPPPSAQVAIEVPHALSVLADPLRLEDVLVNLLTNAYRYGGTAVQVSAAAEGPRVRLGVTDDGPGVPEELLPHLFEPFTRGRGSRDVDGSGLGLAITRGLVEAQGGRLWHERIEPRGARFVVELPAP